MSMHVWCAGASQCTSREVTPADEQQPDATAAAAIEGDNTQTERRGSGPHMPEQDIVAAAVAAASAAAAAEQEEGGATHSNSGGVQEIGGVSFNEAVGLSSKDEAQVAVCACHTPVVSWYSSCPISIWTTYLLKVLRNVRHFLPCSLTFLIRNDQLDWSSFLCRSCLP